MNDIKAYRVEDSKSDEGYITIVFATSVNEAKTIALTTDSCSEARYIDIRVKRLPGQTIFIKGNPRLIGTTLKQGSPSSVISLGSVQKPRLNVILVQLNLTVYGMRRKTMYESPIEIQEFVGIDTRYYVITHWMPLPEPPKPQ